MDEKQSNIKADQPSKQEKQILNKYQILKKIGQGSFGCVYQCKIKGTEIEVAVKTIKIKDAQRNNMRIDDILNEVKVLNEVKSPFIMKLIDQKVEEDMLQLVCECIQGKDLLSCIENYGSISEKVARTWFKKILQGVHHIHESKIIHRDLKLENIFLKFRKVGSAEVIDQVKIVDFGFGIKSDKNVKGLMGTPNQMPPEALKKQPQNNKFDMWSVGIILQVVLVGDFPFKGRDLNNLYKNIKTQPLNLDIKELDKVSRPCKDFLTKLLTKEAENRMSSGTALEHEWLKGETDPDIELTNDPKVDKSGLVANLRAYKNSNKLNKAIKMFNHKLCKDSKDVGKMRDLFLSSDSNKNGSLEKVELRSCLKKLQGDLKDEEADDLFDMLDVNQDGNINQDEFIGALNVSTRENNAMNIEFLFQHMDKDSSGSITTDELKSFLRDNDVSFLEVDVNTIMNSLDNNKDGTISIDEFKESQNRLLEKVK